MNQGGFKNTDCGGPSVPSMPERVNRRGRRVRAPGLHDPQRRDVSTNVGRVHSPGGLAWRALFGLLWFSIIALPSQGQLTNQNTRVLSLKECIELALDHNLDIQVARYSPQLARYRLQSSYGAFDPVLTLKGEDD